MGTNSEACPFCSLADERIVDSTALTVTIRDAFPISPGHTLIIPKRHAVSFFQTTSAEGNELFQALHTAKHRLDDEFSPDGYTVGINNGEAAGQTVMHAHIHLIPRFHGDVPEPTGGVRWIFPTKADYQTK